MGKVRIYMSGEFIGEVEDSHTYLTDYPVSSDLSTMKAYLEHSVYDEDYEAAAFYRDYIKTMTK